MFVSDWIIPAVCSAVAGAAGWRAGRKGKPATGLFDVGPEPLKEQGRDDEQGLLAALMGATGDAIIQKDACDRWLAANHAAVNLLKIPLHQLIGRNTDEIGLDYPNVLAFPLCDIDADREAWAAEMPLSKEVSYQRPYGDFRTFEVTRVPVTDEAGGQRSLVIICRDVTSRIEAEAAAAASEKFARVAMDALTSQICVVDQEGQIIFVNHSWRLFSADRPPGVVHYGEGMSYLDVCRKSETVEAEIIANGIRSVLEGNAFVFSHEYRCTDYLDKDKSYCNTVNVARCDMGGEIFAVISHEDITERKTAEENAVYDATHDKLTGLCNRAFFETEVGRLQAKQKTIGIIMIDLDNLKKANDVYGHESGDHLICRAAVCLRRAMRGEDVVARIGGDEFVVLVEDTSLHVLSLIVKRIRDEEAAINRSSVTEPVKLGMSIGVALYDGTKPFAEAMRVADKMMYAEKAARKQMGRVPAR